MGTDATTTLRCDACGRDNSVDALFCDRCTFPLRVVGLHELTAADKRICLSYLFDHLARATRDPSVGDAVDGELWNAYLSAFWLRPETAMIEYCEARAIRAAAPAPGGPWLDLGCGDGIHAALYSGWRFDDAFDAFASLDLSAADVYNRFDAADFSVTHVTEGRRVEIGLDIKPTAIQRASALGVFDRIERADATRLPIDDATVAVIFSNMLRDLGEPLDAALAECARVLRHDGMLLLSVMTPAYADALTFAPAARAADATGDRAAAEQLLRLDRGRSVFCRRQLTAAQWDTLLARHGLRIDRVHTVLTGEIIRLWDTGLRPFTTDLLRWRQQAGRAPMLAVKRTALPLLDHVLRPIVSRATSVGEACMQLLVVRKEPPR